MKSLNLTTLVLAATAALGLPAAAQQAAFPTKPVTIITSFPAGSGPDAVLRQVSEKLSKPWGQPVLISNKPGGGGFIAIEASQRALADGDTLVQLDSEHLSALPLLYKAKGYVTLNNFDPVAPLFRTPFFVAVPADSKWQNMKDLIGAAKAAPNKVNFGSWGIGSPGHLGGEQLELLSGIDMTHVAYREMSQLFTSVGSGELQWSFGTIPSSQGIYEAGKLRYIAVAAAVGPGGRMSVGDGTTADSGTASPPCASAWRRSPGHTTYRASRARSWIAMRIDAVRCGASVRLNSTPMRRPSLNISKSSSAPAWVAQKQASSGRAIRRTWSSANPYHEAPHFGCRPSAPGSAIPSSSCSRPESRR